MTGEICAAAQLVLSDAHHLHYPFSMSNFAERLQETDHSHQYFGRPSAKGSAVTKKVLSNRGTSPAAMTAGDYTYCTKNDKTNRQTWLCTSFCRASRPSRFPNAIKYGYSSI